MKIEQYLNSLPKSIISGDEVQLPQHAIRNILKFARLNENDVFYHLGCGDGRAIVLAIQEFGVRKAVGIDNDSEKIAEARKLVQERKLENAYFECDDIVKSEIKNATVILFWFSDSQIIEDMNVKFSHLNEGCKIITLWNPLPKCLPDKVDFPFILNISPFKKAKDLKEQILAIFETDCIDFITAWEFAERYTKAIQDPHAESNRFLTIIQSLVIWINAKNMGVACGKEIPAPIRNYIYILRTFFGIEVEHLIK